MALLMDVMMTAVKVLLVGAVAWGSLYADGPLGVLCWWVTVLITAHLIART